MIFNKHSNLEGQHAFLGASKYHWINYETEDLQQRLRNSYFTEIGTLLHAEACKHIKHCFKLSNSDKKSIILELLDKGIPGNVLDMIDFDMVFNNLKNYVNDAIGYKMCPEIILYFSENCFGTADAIIFRNGLLRIHDLKTGSVPAHMEQLRIYAALFCLEYKTKPSDIEMELRIYQNNEILIDEPAADDIVPIMDKIITFDKVIRKIKEEC